MHVFRLDSTGQFAVPICSHPRESAVT